MYQSYPGGAQSGAPTSAPSPANPPQSVVRASQVMYLGIAASVIGIIIDLIMRHTIRTAIVQHSSNMTASQINNAYHAELAVLVVFGLIGAGLWFWMAQNCLAGKSWARTTSTVFFGIDTLAVILGIAVTPGGGLTRIYGFVVWVIGLVAVLLLWQRPSSEYFRAPRY